MAYDTGMVREKIDNYKFNCYNIVAFDKIMKRLVDAQTFHDKPMQTGPNNKVLPNGSISPDLVIESPTIPYAAINELKSSFPNDDRSYRDQAYKRVARQLLMYDDNLSGWNYETSDAHDLMLTTRPVFSNKFKRYLEEHISNYKFSKKLIIIDSSIDDRRDGGVITIKKHSGTINNAALELKLSDAVTINMNNILVEMSRVKFCDSVPPTEYTMLILWDMIFSKIPSKDTNSKAPPKHTTIFTVDSDEIHSILKQEFTHESSPHCIEKSWITMALDAFVQIGVAKKLHPGKYKISYRKKDKTLDWMLSQMSKHPQLDPGDPDSPE